MDPKKESDFEEFKDGWFKVMPQKNYGEEIYADTVEEINNEENFQINFSVIKNLLDIALEKAEKTDSAKIFKETVTQIIPKINEIKEWIEYLDEIKNEINNRNLEITNIELIENETSEIEKWKNFEKDVKQLIADSAIEIGKESLKGAVKVGKNIIGEVVIRAIKLSKKHKEKRLKAKDSKTAEKIQSKREQLKNDKYEIIVDDEDEEIYSEIDSEKKSVPEENHNTEQNEIVPENFEYEDIYSWTDASKKDSFKASNEMHTIEIFETIDEQDAYEDIFSYTDVEENNSIEEHENNEKKDIAFKRIIRQFKTLGNGEKQRFNSPKLKKYAKTIIKTTNKAIDFLKDAPEELSKLANEVKSTVDSRVNEEIEKSKQREAIRQKDKIKKEAERQQAKIEKANKRQQEKIERKNKRQQAKDDFEKRKNDQLIKVLIQGEKFSKNLMKKIETVVSTQKEKLEEQNKQIGQNENSNKVQYTIQQIDKNNEKPKQERDTMEM